MPQDNNTSDRKRRILPGMALLIPGLCCLAYIGIWCAGLLQWSLDIGICFILASGLAMTGYGIMLIFGIRIKWFSRHKLVKRFIWIVLALFLCSFITLESLVIRGAIHNDTDVTADFVLIPGAAVVQDKPSTILRHRLEKAIPYIQSHPKAVVIVSGAKGADESYSEAEVMRLFLVAHGIDNSRIIKEEKATNSIQNVSYSEEIMEESMLGHKPRIIIVTNDFHMFRMRLLAKVQGIAAYGISAPVHYSVVPICYCREYFSLMKLLLTGMQSE
jgi:uncharacterized SAM-binding protein YcdF (DUF218 family)